MDDLPISRWLAHAGIVVLAAIGGMLGYSMREADKGAPVNTWRTIIEGLGSGFVGVLVLLLCIEWEFSLLWAAFISGALGWPGATASIRLLERFLFEKLGIKMAGKTDEGDGA